ncbi:MAG: DUF1003 domain-containing protein [Myxococcales bacterium]|nr:DUF1003 domain-containing protein [Myxococcales bacterium]
MPTNAEMLADVPMFALLDDAERAALAERLDTVTIEAGKVVFSTGDPGDTLYVVRRGEVEIFFKNDTGARIVLETARPGDFFGEISLLDAGPRTASALVTEELEALVVDRGDLDEFLRIKPAAALDLMTALGRRLRETARLLRHTASRDINAVEEDMRSRVQKVADWISEFSGSLPFLFLHVAGFSAWIVLNVGPLAATPIGGFDPFPFGLLTMAVSLEAIILSVFVLLSQNRQVARERVRNDIEYEVNLKAELEIAHMHERLDDMHHEMLARMEKIEGAVRARPASVGPQPAADGAPRAT